MSQPIIVTARPFAIFTQTDTNIPQGGSAAGPGVAAGQVVAGELASKDNVKIDDDLDYPEIVVTAEKIKGDISRVAVAATIIVVQGPSGFYAPCIGYVGYNEVVGNARNMTLDL